MVLLSSIHHKISHSSSTETFLDFLKDATHSVQASFFLQNDAREQRFDVTVATVAVVAVQQISYCMVSRDHMGILAVW